MANEIQFTVSGTLANGKLKDSIATEVINYNQATESASSGTISTNSSTDTAVLTTPSVGWLYLRNLDSTNSIQFGLTGDYWGTLAPNDFTLMKVNSGLAILAKAGASTPLLGFRFWSA